MVFEVTFSLGDIAAIVGIGAMLYGVQWKISRIFNKFCLELQLVKKDLANVKQRLTEHLQMIFED